MDGGLHSEPKPSYYGAEEAVFSGYSPSSPGIMYDQGDTYNGPVVEATPVPVHIGHVDLAPMKVDAGRSTLQALHPSLSLGAPMLGESKLSSRDNKDGEGKFGNK